MDWDFCDVTLVSSCLATGRLLMSLVTSSLLMSLDLVMSSLVSSSLWKRPCKDFFKGKCCSAGQGNTLRAFGPYCRACY